ncbi:MAG: hypothetical protein JWO82_4398 [Akkermansiaceae bacterium]|nr:hypothetical protein [Akkermansiaceae bacterium]
MITPDCNAPAMLDESEPAATLPAVTTLGSWLTCAPQDFDGDETFFARDTGLLSHGLVTCGVSSKAILIGAPRPNDAPDLLRVPLSDLVRADWWREQGAEAVVLQTWSWRSLTPVAAAVRAAGCRLVLIQDSSGVTSPLVGWMDWVRQMWYFSRREKWPLPRFLLRFVHSHTIRLFRFERERAAQFALADLLAVPSPPAVRRFRQLSRRFGGEAWERKVQLIPHPIASWFSWDGTPKENRVTAIGRWKDFPQKRPDILSAALTEFLIAHPGWAADLFGTLDESLQTWHAGLPADVARRVILHGHVSSLELVAHLNRTKIVFCSSAYESFHIASGEGLCSGASVVGTDAGMTASHRWFVSEESGTLAEKLDAGLLAAALATEADHWQQGHRDPSAISATWSARLHAPQVAAELIRQIANLPSESPERAKGDSPG